MKMLGNAFKGALVGVVFAVLCTGLTSLSMGLFDSEYIFFIGIVLSIISSVLGALVGVYFGISDTKAEKARQEAEYKKNKGIWASEVKQNALKVSQVCSENKLMDTQLVSVKYKANLQVEEILNELVRMAELQGEVDAIVEESY